MAGPATARPVAVNADDRRSLVAAVQRNCDIADAAHATDLPLCIFLLQMRELYRWQQGLGFDAALDGDALGRWLAAREAHWAALEGQPFEPLPLGGPWLDPFDLAAIDEHLAGSGLVYGAGLIGPGRPAFFIAEQHPATASVPGLAVRHCGRELARGLLAPPAVLQGKTVVLRRESLARWLWERYEAFSLRRHDGPFAEVARAFGLTDSAAFVQSLPRLVDTLSGGLLLHEQGEHQAAAWLEPGWAALRLALRQPRPAQQLRAVRDHIADLTVTLPTLLGRGDALPLHFWFSHYEGWRQTLFPGLAEAYAAWRAGDEGALPEACERGAGHFRALALDLLRLRDPIAVERRLAEDSAVCAG